MNSPDGHVKAGATISPSGSTGPHSLSPDVLKIVTLGDDDRKKAKLRKAFSAGGVAGIAVTDLDGNGVQEVLAAVRIVGATRVDVWRVE